jgi:hypothetical protein
VRTLVDSRLGRLVGPAPCLLQEGETEVAVSFVPKELDESSEPGWHEAEEDVGDSDAKVDARAEMHVDGLVFGTLTTGLCLCVHLLDVLSELAVDLHRGSHIEAKCGK